MRIDPDIIYNSDELFYGIELPKVVSFEVGKADKFFGYGFNYPKGTEEELNGTCNRCSNCSGAPCALVHIPIEYFYIDDNENVFATFN